VLAFDDVSPQAPVHVLIIPKETLASLNDVGNDVRVISSSSALFMDSVRRIASNAETTLNDVRAGRGTIGQLLTSDELYRRALGVATEAERTMQSVGAAAAKTESIVTNFTAPAGPGERVIADIREVLTHARDAMSDLAENTEALKRNFLFRGFFNQRGFFNLDSMSLNEYRRFTQNGRQYTMLRIWLAADLLFSAAPDAVPELTVEGRRRLNSAMEQLLQHPQDSPLVIEGYSTAVSPDERFLEAQLRARIVRDHLLDRFSRSTNLTGTMPVGADAPGSPSHDNRWDGVALALFVRPEALKGN
jgi:hypothetical protein